MRRFKITGLILLVVLLVMTMMAGCQPQQKPLPEQPGPAIPRNNPDRTPDRTPAESRDAADDVADKVIQVPGVERAYTVVVGNTVLIGIDLDANQQEKGISEVKNRAAEKAEADPRIVRAYVSTDPDITSRIREIADNVEKGRPVTDYLDEIGEIIQRLTPKTD